MVVEQEFAPELQVQLVVETADAIENGRRLLAEVGRGVKTEKIVHCLVLSSFGIPSPKRTGGPTLQPFAVSEHEEPPSR
jgi:hypothetical protein